MPVVAYTVANHFPIGVADTVGGFLAWLLAELLLGKALAQRGIALYLTDAKFGALVGVVLGVAFGLTVGKAGSVFLQHCSAVG